MNTPDLNKRLQNGEITVVEQGREPVVVNGFQWNGEYRILSDGRRQWRQLHSDGSPSPFWGWQDSNK